MYLQTQGGTRVPDYSFNSFWGKIQRVFCSYFMFIVALEELHITKIFWFGMLVIKLWCKWIKFDWMCSVSHSIVYLTRWIFCICTFTGNADDYTSFHLQSWGINQCLLRSTFVFWNQESSAQSKSKACNLIWLMFLYIFLILFLVTKIDFSSLLKTVDDTPGLLVYWCFNILHPVFKCYKSGETIC